MLGRMRQNKLVQPIAPLPIRIVPFPWEGFASLISRVAEQMGYRNPAWVLRPEELHYTVQPFNLSHLYNKRDYIFFEDLLRLDEETLYQLTFHRFASYIQFLDPI